MLLLQLGSSLLDAHTLPPLVIEASPHLIQLIVLPCALILHIADSPLQLLQSPLLLSRLVPHSLSSILIILHLLP
jgi:hypothetical protein